MKLNNFANTLVTSLDRGKLIRALRAVIEGLLREENEIKELIAKVEPRLRE
jgi:hypothetical protein